MVLYQEIPCFSAGSLLWGTDQLLKRKLNYHSLFKLLLNDEELLVPRGTSGCSPADLSRGILVRLDILNPVRDDPKSFFNE